MRAGRTAPDQSSPKGRIHVLEKGALYVVGTPIGNLGDFSPRARETLEEADFIAAEDTRVTLKLLSRFGIKKSMVSYFEHNKEERGELILGRLRAGETCALVSDAGMPAISDPGELLVAQAAERGLLRSGKYSGLRGSRPHGGDLCAGGKRPAHRPVHL